MGDLQQNFGNYYSSTAFCFYHNLIDFLIRDFIMRSTAVGEKKCINGWDEAANGYVKIKTCTQVEPGCRHIFISDF